MDDQVCVEAVRLEKLSEEGEGEGEERDGEDEDEGACSS